MPLLALTKKTNEKPPSAIISSTVHWYWPTTNILPKNEPLDECNIDEDADDEDDNDDEADGGGGGGSDCRW